MKNEKKNPALDCSSEALYNALENSTDDFVYYCDMKTGVFRYPVRQVEEFELPGPVVESPMTYWRKLVHPDDWERFYKSNMELGVNGKDVHSVEFRARNRMGQYVWLKCRGRLVRDKSGAPEVFAGIMTLMGRQNKIDPLTQLLNRAEFVRALSRGILEDMVEQMAVMVLDINDFRQINEVFDREFGDQLLKDLGQLIQGILPGNASLYRMENDRMSIILENGSQQDMVCLYRAIQGQLALLQEWRHRKVRIGVSAGCVMYPRDGVTVDELCRHVDYALQYAKSQGRDRMEVFSLDILAHKRHTLDLVRQLQDSILHDFRGFSLCYQPQIDARTGRMTGVEALLRWSGEDGNAVSPADFIPVLEQNGMISRVGMWVMETALRDGKKWLREDPGFTVSVNVSALQMLENSFIEELGALLAREHYPCKNLVIELTETCSVQNIHAFGERFQQIRSMGVRVAMDDFGTGYSSLEYLKTMPVDIVKIDRSFVKDILNSTFDAAFISFIVTICHDVGILVCLEGIEREEEFLFLKDKGLDCYQGYYFGRPQPREQIIPSRPGPAAGIPG